VANNQIRHLENISHLTSLEDLWINHNQLESFDELERECRGMSHLETVYLEGNPLETQAGPRYRAKVRLAIPWIRQVDATVMPPPATKTATAPV